MFITEKLILLFSGGGGVTNTWEHQDAASKRLSHPTSQNHTGMLEVQNVNRAVETKCKTCLLARKQQLTCFADNLRVPRDVLQVLS